MVWTIPNTFTGGTPANANEMNENFTSIKQFVDVLETQGANNEIDISTLTTNKADINGSTTQRFSVANPVSSLDAVNLQTLKDLTLNSRDTINGFKLSKTNNNTISATPGSCYDSTYEFMITSTLTLSKSEGLGANATYYVFVCGDAQGENPQLVFTTSSTTPTLPSGYDYYRRIGNFTTDGYANINRVLNEGQTVNNFVGFIGGQMGGGGIGTITLAENRWLYARVSARNTQAFIYINNLIVANEYTAKEWNDAHSVMIPCMAGQTIRIEGGWSEVIWYQMI